MKTLLITAPEQLRAHLRGLSARLLISTCAALRLEVGHPAEHPPLPRRSPLRALARRHQHLSETDRRPRRAPAAADHRHPDLLALNGVGTDTAGQLLVTTCQNHDRIGSEAAFAMLCGAALYRIVLWRLRWDPRTRA